MPVRWWRPATLWMGESRLRRTRRASVPRSGRIAAIVSRAGGSSIVVSVDTLRVDGPARQRPKAGAAIINDASGGLDPQMNAAVAASGCAYVVSTTARCPACREHFDLRRGPCGHAHRA